MNDPERISRRQLLKDAAVVALSLLVTACSKGTNQGEIVDAKLKAGLCTRGAGVTIIKNPLVIYPGTQMKTLPDEQSSTWYSPPTGTGLLAEGVVVVGGSYRDGDDYSCCFMVFNQNRIGYVFANKNTEGNMEYVDLQTGESRQINSLSFRSPNNIPMSEMMVDVPMVFKYGTGGVIDQYPVFKDKTNGGPSLRYGLVKQLSIRQGRDDRNFQEMLRGLR